MFIPTSNILKPIICMFLLATTMASSARILDETSSQVPLPVEDKAPDASDPTPNNPGVAPIFTQPSGQFPATLPPNPLKPAAPVVAPEPDTSATAPGGAATSTASGSNTSDHPPLSFFMHDILGGSHPSGRVVTGIVANSNSNSNANNLPFSKPNNQILPINDGVPLNTINGVINNNNNNFPSLGGLNGGSPSNTLLQNNGNNNIANGGNNQAFVTAGQLPAGVTLQQLMLGSVTVVDDEITQEQELGSAVLGKAQGFYLASSSDGSSHTLALTALFRGHDDHDMDDTVSFFGVHRTAIPISHMAIIGGTGKYENAKGYATIETLPHQDQHTTDGLETITHFTLYLTP